MNTKVLTISIAAFNVGDYILHTLNSLIVDDQYLSKLEIFIINDESTDNTAKIATQFAEKYPGIINVINKRNGGYGSTINKSIELANGKYFKQLDGDDWYNLDSIPEFIDYLERCESDLVVTPFFKVYEESGKEEIIDNHDINHSMQLIDSITDVTNISMHELTIKTIVLKKNNIKITEKCFYTDNEYVLYPLIYAKTISKFSAPIYCYRLGRIGQSVSIEGARKHYADTRIVASNIFDQVSRNVSLISANKGKYFISIKLQNVADMVYTYYLIVNNNNAKGELIEFDKRLKKESPYIYSLSNIVKKIRILRYTSFFAYTFLAKRECLKWK